MKSAEDIKKYFKKSTLSTNPDRHKAIFEKIQRAQDQSKTTAPALSGLNLRSKIMKSPISKIAAAVVIVLAGFMMLNFFDKGSGIVWAEVAKKVQASRGVIFRRTDTATDSQEDYSMNYLSVTRSRFDFYKGDQIIKTCHDDYETKTSVYIFHDHKKYFKRTGVEGLEQEGLWANPISMIQRFLSQEHRQLEPKTVEGVLCEGIETTDSAFLGANFQADSFMARVWVSIETGYPVFLEGEIVINSDQVRLAFVADQFQWDVELDESIFDPNIPSDYIGMSQ